jgi:hypothetical protein
MCLRWLIMVLLAGAPCQLGTSTVVTRFLQNKSTMLLYLHWQLLSPLQVFQSAALTVRSCTECGTRNLLLEALRAASKAAAASSLRTSSQWLAWAMLTTTYTNCGCLRFVLQYSQLLEPLRPTSKPAARRLQELLACHKRFCEQQLANKKTSRVLEAAFDAEFTQQYMEQVCFQVAAAVQN